MYNRLVRVYDFCGPSTTRVCVTAYVNGNIAYVCVSCGYWTTRFSAVVLLLFVASEPHVLLTVQQGFEITLYHLKQT